MRRSSFTILRTKAFADKSTAVVAVTYQFVLPELSLPAYHFGPLTVSPVTLFALAGILAYQWIFLRRCARARLDPGITREILFWCVVIGLAGAHLWWLLAHWKSVALRDVFSLHGVVSFGDILACCLTGIVIMKLRGSTAAQRWAWYDAGAYTFVFAEMIGRVGCALGHDHLGIFSTSWLAVQFPSGPRFDLGLLEFLFLALFGIVVWLLGRRARPEGFFLALVTFVYGLFRLLLDTVRSQPAQILGVNEDVIGGWLMVLIGAASAWHVLRSRARRSAQVGVPY